MTRHEESVTRRHLGLVLLMVVGATFAAGASGCATMLSGSSQSLHVSSEPPGARVFLNGALVGNTPTTVTTRKGEAATIVGQYPGLPDATVVLGKQVDTMAVLNLFNLFGWLIDMSTGAMWKFDREHVVLQFQTPGWGSPPPPYGAPTQPTSPAYYPQPQYPPYPPHAYAPPNAQPQPPYAASGN